MATILVAMLPQVGHVGPTLEIAATLISRGHRVVYLAGEEFQIPTGRVGAELFKPTEITASLGAKDLEVVHPYNRSDSDLSTRSILVAFEKVQPDLFLVDKIIALKLDLNCLRTVKRLILSTSLLDWQKPPAIPEDEPIIILCPEVLEHPKFRYPRKRLFYAEPAITPMWYGNDLETSFTDRPLIFSAFGTQSLRYTRLAEHYRLVFSLAEQITACDFFLAAEHPQLLANLHRPSNLRIELAMPQRELLSRCSAFITHGGLGSIKESILAGIPMLVLPSFGDQFFNAMRVRYHHLGVALFDRLDSCEFALPASANSLHFAIKLNDTSTMVGSIEVASEVRFRPACIRLLCLCRNLKINRKALAKNLR